MKTHKKCIFGSDIEWDWDDNDEILSTEGMDTIM